MARSKSKQKRQSLRYHKARKRLEERKKRLQSSASGVKPARAK